MRLVSKSYIYEVREERMIAMSKQLTTKSMRIRERSKQYLDRLCERKNLKQLDALDYLIGLAETYDLFDSDWKDRILEGELAEYKDKLAKKQDARIEAEKVKTSLKIKRDLLLKYIDSLEDQAKREFIESMMGEIKDPNFLDSLSDMDVVIVDGKRRLVKMKDGAPMIATVNPDKIVVCETGYHIIDAFCQCKKWRECPIRKTEYVDFMARTRRTPPSQRAPRSRYHR